MRHKTYLGDRVTREKVLKAYTELRKEGIVCRANFSCCSNCGGYEITDIAEKMVRDGKTVNGCVFWHRQDEDCYWENGLLYLRYGDMESTELGTSIHDLFKRTGWIEETDIEKLIAEWSSKSPVREDLKQKAAELFRTAVSDQEISRVLSKPPGNVRLWREKPFEIIADRRWISGVFDRVVVQYAQDGRALRATIFDFKSDVIQNSTEMTELAEHYRPQMEHYRIALSRILAMDPAGIALKLLFLRFGKAYELR